MDLAGSPSESDTEFELPSRHWDSDASDHSDIADISESESDKSLSSDMDDKNEAKLDQDLNLGFSGDKRGIITGKLTFHRLNQKVITNNVYLQTLFHYQVEVNLNFSHRMKEQEAICVGPMELGQELQGFTNKKEKQTCSRREKPLIIFLISGNGRKILEYPCNIPQPL